jgi:hypothetical protein
VSFECEEAWGLLTIQLLVSQCRMIRLKLKFLPLLSESSQIEVCTLSDFACSLEFRHSQYVFIGYMFILQDCVWYSGQSCFTGHLNKTIYNKLWVVQLYYQVVC